MCAKLSGRQWSLVQTGQPAEHVCIHKMSRWTLSEQVNVLGQGPYVRWTISDSNGPLDLMIQRAYGPAPDLEEIWIFCVSVSG